jgi:hypothetical protein
MTRTTVDIPDDLLRELKARAARERTTLSRLLSGLARLALRRPRPKGRLRLPTMGGAPRPGVSVEDRDALFDLMDGR